MESYGIPALSRMQKEAFSLAKEIEEKYPRSLIKEEKGAATLEAFFSRIHDGFLCRDEESAKRTVPVMEAICQTGNKILIGLLIDEVFRFTHGTPQRWLLTGGEALKVYRSYRDDLMLNGVMPFFKAKPERMAVDSLSYELTNEEDYGLIYDFLLARKEVADEILMNFSGDLDTDAATFTAIATSPHPSLPSFFYKVKKEGEDKLLGVVGIIKGVPRAAGRVMVGNLCFLFSPKAWEEGVVKKSCSLLVQKALNGEFHGDIATSRYFTHDFVFAYDLIVSAPSVGNLKGNTLLRDLGFIQEGIRKKAYYSPERGITDAAKYYIEKKR